MGNRNVPLGIAVGVILLVAGIVGVGIYCQSTAFSSADPVVVSAMKPRVSSQKVMAKTYRNDVYGLEFSCSPEWGNVDTEKGRLYIRGNGNWIFQLDTQMENPVENDFYRIPKNASVDDWIIKKQGKAYKDEGDGYFSNKVGSEFDIAGLKTLHLVSRQQQGGSYDEFYFVKDGRLFALTIVNDPLMMEDLKLDDDSQWYTRILRSFKTTNVR